MSLCNQHIAVVGAGFTGLAAAYDLARAGFRVTLLEVEPSVGGLAGAFESGGERLDRFYHHWFTSDRHVMALIEELGLASEVLLNPTDTAVYYNRSIHRLSTPRDLLHFSALPLLDRLRLGLLTLRARRVRDWRALEELSAADWLRRLGGERVWQVVWAPLMQGKFGPCAEEVSAVWMWNKLKLRGGSRGRGGEERLAYFRGSFARLAEALAERIRALGGEVRLQNPVQRIAPEGGGWQLSGPWGKYRADQVIATPALPLVASMVADWAPADYLATLNRIRWLANICLVLELERPLSSTYWLNVNDPGFPWVGVIEHTNFTSPGDYGGAHVVYLSKYLPAEAPLYGMDADQVLAFSLPHLHRMFPAFRPDWVRRHHLWKARWAQPVVERHYSRLIPPHEGPAPGLWLCSMAQIYPEDRGTNYAIREGRRMAARLIEGAGLAPLPAGRGAD